MYFNNVSKYVNTVQYFIILTEYASTVKRTDLYYGFSQSHLLKENIQKLNGFNECKEYKEYNTKIQ